MRIHVCTVYPRPSPNLLDEGRCQNAPTSTQEKRTLHCLSFLIGCPTLHPNAFAKSSLFESGPITRKLVGE